MEHCALVGVLERNDGAVKRRRIRKRSALLGLLASFIPLAQAQSCISLESSTQCSAFNASSISTSLTSQYPFLLYVSNTEEFDRRLSQYIITDYVQLKYQQLLGCDNVNLTNTTTLYARYTTSVICNALVQNSIQPCSLSNDASTPMCAESCAQQATSEESITANNQLCGNPNPAYLDQIRADFTNCALPSNSLSQQCITGDENEPNNCGYSSNLQSLCGHCASSSPNATDPCCAASNVTDRCVGVVLPTETSSLPPLFPSSTSASNPSATGTDTEDVDDGLSAGQIAGIVIGSVLGAALLAGLLLFCCIRLRKRRGSQKGSIFNQPNPPRGGTTGMVFAPSNVDRTVHPAYETEPVGRVARMSAMEGGSSDSRSRKNVGGGDAVGSSPRAYGDSSDSEKYGDTPSVRGGRVPPLTGKRNGSLSSHSMMGGFDDSSSPQSNSNGQYSSPDGMASGTSEQLPYFKDYYSQDEIHPNDKVATLWAYQPRAGDEFELERGDMLRVVGIWDDGWATGVRINERAENYDGKLKLQRDSGVSNGSGERATSPLPSGEIKAFPLVCVCLPEHWRNTIEGDEHDGPAGLHPDYGH